MSSRTRARFCEFLADPRTHGLSTPPIRIDTHGAIVFLAGEDAYKVKRAVRFPFMDLSTLARRKAACEAEIAVNAANAPTIYLGAVPVTRGKEGPGTRRRRRSRGVGRPHAPLRRAADARPRGRSRRAFAGAAGQGRARHPCLARPRARCATARPRRNRSAATCSRTRRLFARAREFFPKDRAEALIARSRDVLEPPLGPAARARPRRLRPPLPRRPASAQPRAPRGRADALRRRRVRRRDRHRATSSTTSPSCSWTSGNATSRARRTSC